MENKRFTYGLLGVLALIVVVAAVSPGITGDAMRSRLSRRPSSSPASSPTRTLETTYDASNLKAQDVYARPQVEDPQEIKWCQETDGGRDYGVKGTTDAWNGTIVDSCKWGRLVEGYCNDELEATAEHKNCGQINQGDICFDGACVPNACEDSDGGNVSDVKGTASNLIGMNGTDHCLNNDQLNETMCGGWNGNGIVGTTIGCAMQFGKTCQDGACV